MTTATEMKLTEWSEHSDVSQYPRLYRPEDYLIEHGGQLTEEQLERVKMADHQLLLTLGRLTAPQVVYVRGTPRPEQTERKRLADLPEEMIWRAVNEVANDHQRDGWCLATESDGSILARLDAHFLTPYKAARAYRAEQEERAAEIAAAKAAAEQEDFRRGVEAWRNFAGIA